MNDDQQLHSAVIQHRFHTLLGGEHYNAHAIPLQSANAMSFPCPRTDHFLSNLVGWVHKVTFAL